MTTSPSPSSDPIATAIVANLIQRMGGALAVPTHKALGLLGQSDSVAAAQRRRERGTLPFREVEFSSDGRKSVTVAEIARVILGRAIDVLPDHVPGDASPAPRRPGRPRKAAHAGNEARHG